MSEVVVFEQAGLKIIKYFGIPRSDGKNNIRFELRREQEKYEVLVNTSLTLSYDQMEALTGSIFMSGEEAKTSTKDLVFLDREILPISDRKFGVVVTKEEALSFRAYGYKVITLPIPSRRKKDDTLQHHIEIYIDVNDRKDGKFDIPLLETVGRATVIASPFPWKSGNRSGVRAYAKSIQIVNVIEKKQ